MTTHTSIRVSINKQGVCIITHEYSYFEPKTLGVNGYFHHSSKEELHKCCTKIKEELFM